MLCIISPLYFKRVEISATALVKMVSFDCVYQSDMTFLAHL